MKIDWKKIHDEYGTGFVVLVWDADGDAVLSETANIVPTKTGWRADAGDAYWRFPDWLSGQCPGPWDSTIIEFPGRYDDNPAASLSELSTTLHTKAAEGKDAAKRARKVDAAIAAVDAFLKAHGKTLDAAGVGVVFSVKDTNQ